MEWFCDEPIYRCGFDFESNAMLASVEYEVCFMPICGCASAFVLG
jgi:hypothetical protein